MSRRATDQKECLSISDSLQTQARKNGTMETDNATIFMHSRRERIGQVYVRWHAKEKAFAWRAPEYPAFVKWSAPDFQLPCDAFMNAIFTVEKHADRIAADLAYSG